MSQSVVTIIRDSAITYHHAAASEFNFARVAHVGNVDLKLRTDLSRYLIKPQQQGCFMQRRYLYVYLSVCLSVHLFVCLIVYSFVASVM